MRFCLLFCTRAESAFLIFSCSVKCGRSHLHRCSHQSRDQSHKCFERVHQTRKLEPLNTMFLRVLCLSLLSIGIATAFRPIIVASRHKTAHFAANADKIGHLEPIAPRGDDSTSPDVPGIPEGASSWPSPIQEPVIDPGDSDTPGLRKGIPDWPTPGQEPQVGFGQGPPETPRSIVRRECG